MKKIHLKILAEVCLAFILGLRPFLGPASCCYTVTCTDFARLQLEKEPLLAAIKAIIKRLFSCHPLALRFKQK